jgi:hypothetical protein
MFNLWGSLTLASSFSVNNHILFSLQVVINLVDTFLRYILFYTINFAVNLKWLFQLMQTKQI